MEIHNWALRHRILVYYTSIFVIMHVFILEAYNMKVRKAQLKLNIPLLFISQ